MGDIGRLDSLSSFVIACYDKELIELVLKLVNTRYEHLIMDAVKGKEGKEVNLVELQSRLKAGKTKFNAFGKYSYGEEILEAVKPLLKGIGN